MTVVLSLLCSDGLVIAADSQVTDRDRGVSYPARKLHRLGSHAGWGGSGARAVLFDLQRRFGDSGDSILGSDDAGRALQKAVLPIMRYHYDHFIGDVPGDEQAGTPSAYVLAAGYSGKQPWIIEINPSGMVSHYEDIGFHAIGSGAPMAVQAGALLSHFRMTERRVDYGVVAAVRVLDTLRQTSPSVGGELDLIRITPDGAHEFDDDAISDVRPLVDRWTDLEQQALDDLFADQVTRT